MFQAKQIAAVLIAACLASTGEAATRLQPPGAAQNVTIQPSGRAYLFRGFIGVLDWGMDELAQRINGTGVTATVNSYLVWRGVADQAIGDYRRDPEPIAIIGHSLGGDAAMAFAERLAAAMQAISGGLGVNGTLMVIGAVGALTVNSLDMLGKRAAVRGWYSGTSADSEDTLAFSQLNAIASRNEIFPFEEAQAAYDRMMSGKARFRVVLKI